MPDKLIFKLSNNMINLEQGPKASEIDVGDVFTASKKGVCDVFRASKIDVCSFFFRASTIDVIQ